jgi:hypothetical protein
VIEVLVIQTEAQPASEVIDIIRHPDRSAAEWRDLLFDWDSAHAMRCDDVANLGELTNKIKLKKVACFSDPKSVRQHTTIHQQSTTTSPQKNHAKTHIFAKPPAKTPLYHAVKK